MRSLYYPQSAKGYKLLNHCDTSLIHSNIKAQGGQVGLPAVRFSISTLSEKKSKTLEMHHFQLVFNLSKWSEIKRPLEMLIFNLENSPEHSA